MTALLGIFAKWPAPGQVKTRLGLPSEDAARAARAFLLDTVARLRGVAARTDSRPPRKRASSSKRSLTSHTVPPAS